MINEGFDLAYDSEMSSVFKQSPISEAANNRIMQTRRDSINDQAKMAEVLMSLPPLGLKLHKPNSFMNFIETKLFPEDTRQNLSTETNLKKASNADIFHLKIGTWERVAQNKEDLVAKCYFGKRKLIWEILEKGLKRKIQMHWEHILAMRAQIDENRPGILEIELSQPPSFFRETEPQPRKHTLWDNASDFTGGQAMICRRHLLQFPPGALDKLYEKLLQCEPRFFQMSQRPFPSLQSPYFDSDFYNISAISFGYNQNTPQNYYYQNGFMGPEFQMLCNQSNDYSPKSVMEVSRPLGQLVSIENESFSNTGHWGQHSKNYEELMEQRCGMSQDRFSIALTMNQNYEDQLVHNDQLPTMITGNNESEFMNYSGFEGEINCGNYEQESVGSENTESSFYPQCVNWAEEEEVNKFGYTANFGHQNPICPWM